MKWPPKKAGVLRHTPDHPKSQLKAQINSALEIAQHQFCGHKFARPQVDPTPLVCGSCRHEIRRFAIMPQGHTHFAQEVCGLCGRWLRWLPRPANVERQKLNAFRLAKLAMCDNLTSWERRFVASLAKQKKLSPRQLAVLERLVRQYLEGGAP